MFRKVIFYTQSRGKNSVTELTVTPNGLIYFILGDLTPDTDSVFMQAVQGMFLSKVYDHFDHILQRSND